MQHKNVLFLVMLCLVMTAWPARAATDKEASYISSITGKEYIRIFLEKDNRSLNTLVTQHPKLHPDYLPPTMKDPPKDPPILDCESNKCDLYTAELSGAKAKLLAMYFDDLAGCDYHFGCVFNLYLDRGKDYEPVVMTGADPLGGPIYLSKDWSSILLCRASKRRGIYRAEYKFNLERPGESVTETDFSDEKNLAPCSDNAPAPTPATP